MAAVPMQKEKGRSLPPVRPAGSGPLLALLAVVLSAVTLVLTVNAYDSSILKLPILVTGTGLAAAIFLAGAMRRGRIQWLRSAGDIPVAGLALLSVTGLFFSPVSWHAERAVSVTLACTAIYFAATNLPAARRDFHTAVMFIAVLTGAVVGFGLVQYLFAEQLGVEFYLGPDRRIGSTLGSPAFLGGYLALVSPLVLVAALDSAASRRARFLLGALLAGILAALLLTRSRSSIAGLAASCLLLFFLRAGYVARRRMLAAAFVVAATGIGVFLLLPEGAAVLTALLDIGPGSTLSRRLYFWEAGIRAFLAAPWRGHGAGSFESAMIAFRPADYWTAGSEDIVPHAHNEVIEIAAELGIPGLILAGWLAWRITLSGLKMIRSGEAWIRAVSSGLLCGLAGLAVDNTANVSLRQPPVAAIAALFAGLLLSPLLSGRGGGLPVVRVAVPRRLLFLPLLAFGIFTVWYIPRQASAVEADRHTIRGLLMVGNGEGTGAIGEYRRAASLHSGAFLARSGLAGELLKAGHAAEAASVARALQADYPDYPRSWLVVAVSELSAGRHGEALNAVRTEIRLRDHPEASLVESAIHRERRDTSGERGSLAELLERSLDGRDASHAAYASTRLLQLAATREDTLALLPLFLRLCAMFPVDPVLRRNLAVIRDRRGAEERDR